MATTKRNKGTTAKKSAGDVSAEDDLVYQALETELGGVEVYTAALENVQNDDLREEWEEYLEQTRNHVEIAEALCEELGLDPARETPGRKIVRAIGKALVKAIQDAGRGGDAKAAEIVAAECVTLAETKDHSNWALISKLAEKSSGERKDALREAADQVEDEEDEHLYHTSGWARELWLDALGLDAELPPPEEEDDVKTEEEAVESKQRSMKSRG